MKIRSRLAALLCVLLLASVLSACAKTLSGTYKAEALGNGAAFIFDGKKVQVNVLVLGSVVTTLSGTYEIGGNTITLTFGDTESEAAKTYGGTFDFTEGENSVKIGMIEYEKVS